MEQIQDIKEAVQIYNKGLSNLLGNSNEWKEFLKFNAKFYKYKFHENLLLYAQDKNVTACATFDEWKKVGRYVKPKPYCTTLKTIYAQNGRLYLKSVFDISSTNSKYDVDFKIWKTNEKETLEILTKELDINTDFIQGDLGNLVSVYIGELLGDSEFVEKAELSNEQLNDDNFLSTFIESVTTIVLNRCGTEYTSNLSRYSEIKDIGQLKKLGYIVNKCSYDLIKIVELEIKQRLKNKEWEELWYERNNISKNEESIGGNKTSEISRPSDDRDNKRNVGDEFSRDSKSRGNNRRTIKKAISKTKYRKLYRNSTIREQNTPFEDGNNRQYDNRKSKGNVKQYNEGVEQTTLFNLPKNNEETNTQEENNIPQENTPTEVTFAGYKVGDKVYLDTDEPRYIRKIDIENNYVLVSIVPDTDYVLQRFSIQEFENKLYNNPLNNKTIEDNKVDDLQKLAEITDINPLTQGNEEITLENIPSPHSIPSFKIPDDLKDDSIGLKRKYEENIEAIKLLKQLEYEDRDATDEEKIILARYNGWGGLDKAFKQDSPQYTELKELLTDEEYASAENSVNTAFYTEPYIIDFIYKAIQQFGITGKCNILDPAARGWKLFGKNTYRI
ncbi:MAG: hypothetical protein HFJ38_05735 [Bacilli bacterium]|nr:hypothetical protein [Bacilli bacterium]